MSDTSDEPIRIRAGEVARMTGFSRRTVQIMAISGELPSALQRKPGGNWTFDRLEIRRWIKRREEASCRTSTFTVAERPGISKLSFAADHIDEAYAQLIGPRRGRGATRSWKS